MIMKKRVLLFISLLPISVFASSVIVDAPEFRAEMKEGSTFTRLESKDVSFDIPKGLSIDAYRSEDFMGDSKSYFPGEYNKLSDVKSFKVKEEYIEKVALEMVFNEGRTEDPTFCLDASYMDRYYNTISLGEICSGSKTVLFYSIPAGFRNGETFKFILRQFGVGLVMMADMGIQNDQVELYRTGTLDYGMQANMPKPGVLNITYDFRGFN